MHSDTHNEMQLRVLSGMHMYPELFKTTPQYLTGDEPWHTVRRALEALHAGKVDSEGVFEGMRKKYGQDYVDALCSVIENAASVPRKRWAETQIRRYNEMLDQDFERESDYAA